VALALGSVVAVRVVTAPAGSERPFVYGDRPSSLRLEPADPSPSRAAGTAGRGDVPIVDAPVAVLGGGEVVAAAGPPPIVVPPAPAGGGEIEIAPPPEEFEAPPPPPAPPPEPLRTPAATSSAPSGTGVWAVMIGINDYPGSRGDLRSAVNDVNDVNEALFRFGVPGNQRLLIRDRQATAGVIAAAADWLAANAGPEATAVFFYAGHVRKMSSRTEAMVGADGRVVTDAQLADRLRGLAARKTWIVMASCYGGGFDEALAPGRVLTAAADANHLAYENAAYGRSYLVQFMVREAMIEGRAPTSVQAAYDYARAELTRRHPGRVPVEYDRAGVPIDLRHRAPSPSQPPPPSGSSPPPPTTAPPPSDERCTQLGLVSVNCS
jgi:hypothetical protein